MLPASRPAPPTSVRPPSPSFTAQQDVTLLDLLDRILDKGVVVQGDITLSVADVDLVYLGLKVMVGSFETVERMRNRTLDDAMSPSF